MISPDTRPTRKAKRAPFSMKKCSTGTTKRWMILYTRPIDGETFPMRFVAGESCLCMPGEHAATMFRNYPNVLAAVDRAKKQRYSRGKYRIVPLGEARRS